MLFFVPLFFFFFLFSLYFPIFHYPPSFPLYPVIFAVEKKVEKKNVRIYRWCFTNNSHKYQYTLCVLLNEYKIKINYRTFLFLSLSFKNNPSFSTPFLQSIFLFLLFFSSSCSPFLFSSATRDVEKKSIRNRRICHF